MSNSLKITDSKSSTSKSASSSASSIEKLKEKLRKQKEKEEERGIEVEKKEKPNKKQKKVALVPKSQKHLTQRFDEQASMRENFGKILKEDFKIGYLDYAKEIRFNSEEKSDQSSLQASWDSLDESLKRKYTYKGFGKQKNAGWGREHFLLEFAKLSIPLQDDFIKKFLEQDLSYSDFYTKWSSDPEITEKIRESVIESEKGEGKVILEKGTIGQVRSEVLREIMEYADSHGIEYEKEDEKVTATKLLENFSEKQRKHALKTTYQVAEIMGINNPEKLTFAHLTSRMYNKGTALSGIVSQSDLNRIKTFTKGEIIKAIQKYYKENENAKPISLKLEKLNDAALTYALLMIISKGYTILGISRIKASRSSSSRSSSVKLVEGKFNTFNTLEGLREEFPKATQQELKRILENRQVTGNLVEAENLSYIDKLARITEKPRDFYKDWSLEKLQATYYDLEAGDEYYEEYSKEALIDSLVELSGEKVEKYVEKGYDELKQELEELEKTMKNQTFRESIKGEYTRAQKCMETFKEYTWIKGKVTGVWISPIDNKKKKILPYILPGGTTTEIQGTIFYPVSPRYFLLQCNRFSYKRIQNGNILTCFEVNGSPVSFTVGYTIRGMKSDFKGVKSFKILSGLHKDERFIIQNDEIFSREQDKLKEEQKVRSEKIENILNKYVNSTSIKIGTNFLSAALLEIAPENNEYGKNDPRTPYLKEAIEEVIKDDMTNREFFEKIATFTVFLKKELGSNIFLKRVKGGYYLPTFLLSLSEKEKLPEIYDNSRTSEKREKIVTSYIQGQIHTIIYMMATTLFYAENLGSKRTYQEIKGNNTTENILAYDEDTCVNYENAKNINKDNLTFYTDENDNTYCLDIEKLVERFQEGNFKNPETGENFSKDFIRLYTVSYYDPEAGKIFVVPFKKLYTNFRKGNIINSKTGKAYNPKFVQSILNGSLEKSIYERGRKFKKLDVLVGQCANPEDVRGEDPENVIFYKDRMDGNTYCFPIREIVSRVENGILDNPHTGRTFSKNFISKFSKTFVKTLWLPKTELEMKQVKDKEEEELQKIREAHFSEAVLIPDLWNMIMTDLADLEGKENEVEVKEKKGKKKKNQEEESEMSFKSTSKSQTSQASSSSSSSRGETVSDSSSVVSEELDKILQNKKEEKAQVVAKSETPIDPFEGLIKDDKKIEEGKVETKISGVFCHHCKNSMKDESIKTIVLNPDVKHAETWYFCSFKCMENQDFPKFKK